MHAGVASRLALRHDADLARPINHLGIDVVPLGQAQDRQMALLAPAAQFAPGAFARRAISAPELHERGKPRFAALEARARRWIFTDAHVGHAQARDNRQQLTLSMEALA